MYGTVLLTVPVLQAKERRTIPALSQPPEQLYYVVFEASDTKGKYYKLANDIYLNDVANANWQSNSPNAWQSKLSPDNDSGFQGNFNGAGHIVYGLYVNNLKDYAKGGLFPRIASDDSITIENVGIKNAYITSQYTGALIGELGNNSLDSQVTVTVSNCFADESVTLAGTSTAGFIGMVSSTCTFNMDNCYSRVIFSDEAYPEGTGKGAFVGGFWNEAARTISNCYVILRNADYEHGFNIFPTNADNLTCSEVHAGNDVNDKQAQRSGSFGNFTGTHWVSDFKGKPGAENQCKLTAFDFANAWVAGATEYDYISLKVFEKTEEEIQIWNGTSDSNLTGEGTDANPFVISTPEQLYYVVFEADNTSGKYYKLDKDIYLNDVSNANWKSNNPKKWESKTSSENAASFNGNFDGDGHIVYGLYVDNSNVGWAKGGLFPSIAAKYSITIKNVGIKDAHISSWLAAGALIGQVICSTTVKVSNCFADESVTLASSTGYAGFIAQISYATLDINNCYSRVIFSETVFPASTDKGAFIGGTSDGATGNISNCYVILRSADYEHGFNALPVYNNDYTCNEVHSNDGYQRGNIPSGLTYTHWTSDFKGRVAETKLSSLDFVNTWQAGKTTDDYISLKIFDKSVWYDVESGVIWNGSDSTAPSLKDPSSANSESNPYIIDTPAKLYNVLSSGREATNGKYYKLSADIYLNDVSRPDWTDSDSLNSWIIETEFAGNLDGGKHTVYGLYYKGGGSTALIPKISSVSDQVIKNLGIDKAYINADYSGVLISHIEKGNDAKIDINGCFVGENVAVIGTVFQAGIIALIKNSNTTVENCYSLADFPVLMTNSDATPTDRQGGLIGCTWELSPEEANKITVKNCYAVTNNNVPVSSISWNATNINFINVYGNEKLDNSWFNFPNIQQLDITQMYGAGAETYMSGLDYDNVWFLKYNEYPVLRAFCNQEELNYFKNSFTSGNGTKDNPYIVSNAEQIYIMRLVPARETKGKYFKLACNISVNDITDSSWKTSNPWIWSSNQYSKFCGILDGNGYVISGLYIISAGEAWGALFNSLGENSYIENLGIENSYMSGEYAAAIAGEISGKYVTVANSYVGTGVEVSASKTAGGIVGNVNADYFTLTRCCFTGTISGGAAAKGCLAASMGNDVNSLTVTFSDSYAAPESGDNIIPSQFEGVRSINLYATNAPSLSGVYSVLTKDNMLGESAVTNMPLLDFDSVWEAQTGAAPALRMFGDNKVYISGNQGDVWSGKIATGYFSGDGTKSNPYIINTAEQLALLAYTSVSEPVLTKDKYYKLSSDIYVNNTESDGWYNSANEWFFDLGYFSIGFLGNLDGDGHTVYGICYTTATNSRCYGLLPALGGSAVVENIAVAEFYSNDEANWVGAVAGFVSLFASAEKPIEIRRCISAESNNVGGTCAGGILGHDSRPIIMSDCLSIAKVKEDQSRGTLIGNIDSPIRTTVRNCLSFNIGRESSFWSSESVKDPIVENVYSTYSALYVSKISIGDITGEKARTTLAGFDFDNVWTTVENGTPVQKIFSESNPSYSFSTDVTITFNYTDGSTKTLSGIPGADIPFAEIQNYDGYEWYLEAAYLRKFNDTVFPGYAITLYAKNEIEAWNGTADSSLEGDGSSNNPYIISNASELYYALTCGTASQGKCYRITNDIYLNNTKLANWENSNPKTWITTNVTFYGSLDGGGHTVYGIYYSDASSDYAGLIPCLSAGLDSTVITNIKIADSYINGKNSGALIGYISSTVNKLTIFGCYVDSGVNVSATDNCGGIVGCNNNAKTVIKSCAFVGNSLTTSGNKGGFIGNNTATVEISDGFAITPDGVNVSSLSNTTFENIYSNVTSCSGVTQLDKSKMIGLDSEKNMTNLSFDEVWQSGVNAYPQLMRFGKRAGDANEDEKIDICDLVRYAVKANGGDGDADDLNNDGNVNSTEVSLVRSYILNKESADVENPETTKTVNGTNYTLVWSDEFNGNSIDYNKWGYGHVNDFSDSSYSLINVTQEQDPDIISVRDGKLQLSANRYFDQSNSGIKYAASKSLQTQKTMNFKYGYLEMRAKVPHKLGAFPAFWLLGTPGLTTRQNTNYYTEIDIFENVGGDKIETNIHKWYTAGSLMSSVFTLDTPANVLKGNEVNKILMDFEKYSTLPYEYHTYSIEWTPEYIKTYMDDTLIDSMYLATSWDSTMDEPNGIGAGTGAKLDETLKQSMEGFHDYVFVLIQNLLDITEPDAYKFKNVNDNSGFPYEYDVDYVRLYQDPNNFNNGLIYLDENGNTVDYYN